MSTPSANILWLGARQLWDTVRSREFTAFTWRRFEEDRMLRVAASLSYTSLLALVPLMAIAFSVLSAFPVFDSVRSQLQDFLFSNFLPETEATVKDYFDGFLANTGQLTALGVVGLAVTAVMLLYTIEAALNAVFRVTEARPLVPRLLTFWAVLTLGPLLIGASFSLSAYLFAASQWLGVDSLGGFQGVLAGILPTLMLMIALMVFYMVIPNRRVRLVDALFGAVIGGLMFSLLRKGFGYYMATSTAHQTLYGAMAVVPVFLVWMYLTWAVVLFGAELAAALGDWRGRQAQQALAVAEPDLSGRIHLAVAIAEYLSDSLVKGSPPLDTSRLADVLKAPEALVQTTLGQFKAAGFADMTSDDRWLLCRDLRPLSLRQFLFALGVLQPLLGNAEGAAKLDQVLRDGDQALSVALDIPLDQVIESRR